jgi:hypothetical protein
MLLTFCFFFSEKGAERGNIQMNDEKKTFIERRG